MCGKRDMNEVNDCSETEEMPTRWKDDGVGWSDLEYQRQETCCMKMALERWSYRESNVVSVE